MTIDAPVSLLISSLLVSTTALPVTLSNNSHITVGSQINLPDVLPTTHIHSANSCYQCWDPFTINASLLQMVSYLILIMLQQLLIPASQE